MQTAATNKEQIRQRLAAHGGRIRACGVKQIALFGSYVRGEQHAGSDVDFLVQFEPGLKSYDHFLELAELLEEILQRPVELVTTEALSPYLGPHIRQEAEDVALGS